MDSHWSGSKRSFYVTFSDRLRVRNGRQGPQSFAYSWSLVILQSCTSIRKSDAPRMVPERKILSQRKYPLQPEMGRLTTSNGSSWNVSTLKTYKGMWLHFQGFHKTFESNFTLPGLAFTSHILMLRLSQLHRRCREWKRDRSWKTVRGQFGSTKFISCWVSLLQHGRRGGCSLGARS